MLDIMDRSRIAEYYVEVMASGEAQSKIFRKKVEETPTEYVSHESLTSSFCTIQGTADVGN